MLNLTRIPLLALLTVFAAFLAGGSSAQAQEQEESPWSFYGDARFRLAFDALTPGVPDRNRQRMRFRFGVNFTITDELTVGTRLVTGDPQVPTNPHVDLGNGFDGLEVNLDRLFFRYSPKEAPGLSVVGGKFSNPIYRNPVFGEFVWDADLQPEGMMVTYNSTGGAFVDSFGFQFAQLAMYEQAPPGDTWGTLAGFNFSKKTGDNQRLEGGVNYTFFGDLTPGGSDALTVRLRGNSMTGDEPTSNFGIVDAVLAYHFGDVVLSAEFINNTRAASDVGDTAVAFGAAVNTDNGKLYYSYSAIEQDAVLSLLSQDDFLSATNFNSHLLGWRKYLTEHTLLHVYVLASEPNELVAGLVDEMVYRFRVDIDIDF